jgi:hypothetical protein
MIYVPGCMPFCLEKMQGLVKHLEEGQTVCGQSNRELPHLMESSLFWGTLLALVICSSDAVGSSWNVQESRQGIAHRGRVGQVVGQSLSEAGVYGTPGGAGELTLSVMATLT